MPTVGERLKEAEKSIKELETSQVGIKKDLEYIKTEIKELKGMDDKVLLKLEDHSKILTILNSSRSLGKRITEIVLGGMVTGTLALIAWFAKEALS